MFFGLFFLYCSINLYAIENLLTETVWPMNKPIDSTKFIGSLPQQELLACLILKQKRPIKIIFDLNSWMGSSILFLAYESSFSQIFALDNWCENLSVGELTPERTELAYYSFLSRCWHIKHRITHFKGAVVDSLNMLHLKGVKPDIIYINGSIDYEKALQQINYILEHFPEAVVCGEDWDFSFQDMILPMQRAVFAAALKYGYRIKHKDSFWYLKKLID